MIEVNNRLMPLVSIIMPNFNCGPFIASAIESVERQTYCNWELLFQDDCSTDNSICVATSYAVKDSRIKIQCNKTNLGAAVTRNYAIARSLGSYLAFLDSDDIWLPNKLQLQISYMQLNNCDFSFTQYEHISESGISLHKQAKVIKKLTYKKMLMHNWPGCLTVVYKQDVNNRVYSEDIKKDNDCALFLRVLKSCKDARGINECLAYYRIRGGSISRNKFKMVKPFITVLHDFEGQSILMSYFCLATHVLIKIFFKYKKVKQ